MSYTHRSHRDPNESTLYQPNPSNVKVLCRIRPPKGFESRADFTKSTMSSGTKNYTSVRHKSRSTSKELNASPYRNYASVRKTSRESAHKQKSGSKDRSMNKSLTGRQTFSTLNGNGQVQADKKYSVFTTKDRSNVVIGCENPVPGKIINESLTDIQDLKYFNNTVLGQSSTFSFNFDAVYNESHKQEKFYTSSIRPAVKSFVEGENACIVLFGPTEGGKTYSLKGKTGIERGIIPRAVEDIFNIVRNSEEREEDFEMINNRMMRHMDDEDSDQNFNRTYHSARNINQLDQLNIVPERMFLKVSVYQIFVDKVLDLLGSHNQALKSKPVTVDHYIDKDSDEVVSKLKNITEKVVFTLEDFYSVLQEAFKNRRIESVQMQEQDLRKKSHFIINLTLMKRTQCKKLIEISHLNFVELSGSEQAVAEEKFYKDSSVRQFVTRSFNGVSSQIVRAALKKKQKVNNIEDGDIKVVNCLRNTLTSTSNIILVCCVNPSPQAFEHSLPAIKFCARIRDCILKKFKAKPRGDNQSMTIDDYHTSERMTSIETIKEIIDHLKDDVVNKQLQRVPDQVEPWSLERLNTIDQITNRILSSHYPEKQQLLLIQELTFLKENIQRMRYTSTTTSNMLTPRQAFGPALSDTYKSQTQSAERLQHCESYGTYNPYQAQSYNYMNSDLKENIQTQNFHSQNIYTDEQQFPQFENKVSQRKQLKPHILNSQPYQSELKQYSEADCTMDRNEIKVYATQDEVSRIQQKADATQSMVSCPENDFLSRVHPLVEQPLRGKQNSLSGPHSPVQLPKAQGYRPQAFTQNLQKSFDLKSPTNLQKLSQSLLSITSKQSKPVAYNDGQMNKRLQKLRDQAVYQSEQEAMVDMNRLMKLGDVEGVKLRVMQIYRERQEQERIIEEQQEIMVQFKDQLDQKEQLMEEQDRIIKDTCQEFQLTLGDINQQKEHSEKSLTQQTNSLQQQLLDTQTKLNEISKQKDSLLKAQEILEFENKNFLKMRDEAEAKQQKVQEENDRLRSNYDILKEHEMNIIKDYEGKKARELNFYETKLVDMHQQTREEGQRNKDLEEQIFRMREEIRKQEHELLKTSEDRQVLLEQVQKLGSRLEKEKESRVEQLRASEKMVQKMEQAESEREKKSQERDKAYGEIEKLHSLIEEMEKAIQGELNKRQEEEKKVQEKEAQLIKLGDENKELDEQVNEKESDIENMRKTEEELKRQLSQMARMHEELEKQLTLIKAKEYDKVDILKRAAELEAKLKYLQVDNENLVRERNNLDLANVSFNKERQDYQQQMLTLEQELDYFRKAHEQHLDKFDSKFDNITVELSKLKNENIQLKEKEKLNRRQIREAEEERDEFRDKYRVADKKCEDMHAKLYELERDVRCLVQERERDVKDSAMRHSMEYKSKEENKGRMLEDIQGMIKQFKDDKKLTKSQGLFASTGANNAYSTHSSVYYS